MLFIVAVSALALVAFLSSDNRVVGLGDTIAESISPPATETSDDTITMPGQTDPDPEQQPDLADSDSQRILSQEDLNQKVRERADAVGQVDSVRVEITEQELVIHMQSYGIPGTFRGQVVARNGAPVVVNGSTGGPLGWVVSSGEIQVVLNEAIAEVVAERGVSVDSVQLQQGHMVFGVS